MLSFKPLREIQEIESYFCEFKITTANVAFLAYENDTLLGKSLLSVDGQNATLIKIEAPLDKPYIAEGLIRASLNLAGNKGAYIVTCKDISNIEILEKMRFQYAADGYWGEIPELLQGACGFSQK